MVRTKKPNPQTATSEQEIREVEEKTQLLVERFEQAGFEVRYDPWGVIHLAPLSWQKAEEIAKKFGF